MSQEPDDAELDEQVRTAPLSEARDPLLTEIKQGVSQNRDTAKWLITILGAVAGAMLAGVQLTSVAKLSGSGKAWAVLGLVVGIVGVLAALLSVATVLASKRVGLDDIQTDPALYRTLAEHKLWLDGYPDPLTLLADYGDTLMKRREAVRAMVQASKDGSTDEVVDKVNRLNETQAALLVDLTWMQAAVDTATDIALDEAHRRTWSRAMVGLATGVLVATMGVAIFVVQSPPSSLPTATISARPAAAVVALTATGKDHFASTLGTGCDFGAMNALVVASTSSSWTVVIDDQSCSMVELHMSTSEASVIALASSCGPPPGPDPTSSTNPSATPPTWPCAPTTTAG